MFFMEIYMGESLRAAYTEYLERMFLESDELTNVDATTIPEDINMAQFEEWAYASWVLAP